MATFYQISRWLLAVFFIVAGVYHFISPEIYLPLIPPYLPWPQALNYVSGAAEIAGGIGICLPRWRRAAGWGLITLLLAVFPANIYMLTSGVLIAGNQVAPWILWLRLPLQGVLMAWIYLSCVRLRSQRSHL